MSILGVKLALMGAENAIPGVHAKYVI